MHNSSVVITPDEWELRFRIGDIVRTTQPIGPWPTLPAGVCGQLMGMEVTGGNMMAGKPFAVLLDLAPLRCTLGSLYPSTFSIDGKPIRMDGSRIDPDEPIFRLNIHLSPDALEIVQAGAGLTFADRASQYIATYRKRIGESAFAALAGA